jgi:hypothetical protein
MHHSDSTEEYRELSIAAMMVKSLKNELTKGVFKAPIKSINSYTRAPGDEDTFFLTNMWGVLRQYLC